MSKKLTLISDQTGADADGIPAGLGVHGARLFRDVMIEYQVDDVAGRTLLEQAARALDRAERCAAQIASDGEMIKVRGKPARAHELLRHELGNRTFAVRTLQKLGLNFEPVREIGRPGGRGA